MSGPQPRPDRRSATQPTGTGLGRAIRRLGAQIRVVVMGFFVGTCWEVTEQGFSRRVYADYESYLHHQRAKLDAAGPNFLARHDARFYEALTARLASLPFDVARRSVLCLGARQGTEVRAFIHRGAFAVGVDLEPGRDNPYVVHGDFHALQYGDHTIDVVYTNSLDHVYDPARVLGEIRRVLAPGGRFIAELVTGAGGPGFFESFAWGTVEEMVTRIANAGFAVAARASFDVPWAGEQVVFLKSGRDVEEGILPA